MTPAVRTAMKFRFLLHNSQCGQDESHAWYNFMTGTGWVNDVCSGYSYYMRGMVCGGDDARAYP